MRCHEKVDNECRLVDLVALMRDQTDSLDDKPCMDFSVVSTRSDSLWLVHLHEYWACDADFEMQRPTGCRLIKTFAGSPNIVV